MRNQPHRKSECAQSVAGTNLSFTNTTNSNNTHTTMNANKIESECLSSSSTLILQTSEMPASRSMPRKKSSLDQPSQQQQQQQQQQHQQQQQQQSLSILQPHCFDETGNVSTSSAPSSISNFSQLRCASSDMQEPLLCVPRCSQIGFDIDDVDVDSAQLLSPTSLHLRVPSISTVNPSIISGGSAAPVAPATLHEIVADVKSGVPSLAEERLKQEKILKKRQLLRGESDSIESFNELDLMQQQQQQLGENVIEVEQSPIPADRFGEGNKKTIVASTSQSLSNNIVGGLLVRPLAERRISSLAYSSKKAHTKKWTAEDTLKFYKSLEIFGTDFSLIAKFFPDRTRIQIKNKFRKEEKENGKVIETHLRFNAKGRFSKVQARIAAKKEEMANEFDSTKELNERVSLLLQQRKSRLLSFESVDAADIEIAEEFNEIFENQRGKNETLSESMQSQSQ